MQVLCELVTVIKEQKPICHWETGKAADVMIFKSGDLPACCTETFTLCATFCFRPRVTGCTSDFAKVNFDAFADFFCMEPLPGVFCGKGFFMLSVRPFLLAVCSIKFVTETYTERGGYFAKVCRKEET